MKLISFKENLLIPESFFLTATRSGSEGKIDEWSSVFPLIFWTPLNERRAKVNQLWRNTALKTVFKMFLYLLQKKKHNLRHNNVMFFIYFQSIFQSKCFKQQSYLTCGAVFVVGADEVRGVGQVNEQLLMRLQSRSRKIQQENLGGNRAMSTGELLTWENFPGLFQDLRSCYSKTNR